MGERRPPPEPGRAIWAAAADPARATAPADADEGALCAAAARLGGLTSPSVAAWLLAPLAARLPGLVEPGEVERSRQLNRFRRARAAEWLGVAAAAGPEVVCLKGLATAHRFYPDPLIRGMGDVDLLVRPRDLGALVAALEAEGFRFVRSADTPAWGMTSEASFHPLVSADGSFVFDLHVAPDDYPVFRSLATEEVFAASREIAVAGVRVRVPSDDHLILLALTNAARDKFDPASVRSMVDVIAAVAHAGVRCDWAALAARARAGGYLRGLRVGVTLLAALGVPRGLLPGDLARRPAWPASRAFDAVRRDYLDLFADEPSKTALQLRDWLLISAPGVLAHRNLRRLRGLLSPWPGVPAPSARR